MSVDWKRRGVSPNITPEDPVCLESKAAKRQKRGLIPNRVGIENRPAIADEKTQLGHIDKK